MKSIILTIAALLALPVLSQPTDAKFSKLHVDKNIELELVATNPAQRPFAPAPSTIYFIGGQVYQKAVGQGNFALINLETKLVDKELGKQFVLGYSQVERCELDLLTALGVMTIAKGAMFTVYEGGYVMKDQLTLPLQDGTRPTVITGQFRCAFPLGGPSPAAIVKQVTGGRIILN